ncbi:MAG TPA: DUF1992 domain-containing protein [Lapillicoccus sp.]|nr:DUF1992 domain-containing protein [Lapillicoccus sp.]
MAQQPHRETWVDRQIREAQERGEFDHLPGAGKPLGDLGDPNDADWWVRSYIKREKLDVSGALPTPLALRREASDFPESLADVRTEADVRDILEDFNRRVKVDRLRPAVGNLPPLIARTVDVDEVVEQWRALRAALTPPPEAPADPPSGATSWWRRLTGR